ncbi:hypothetical protein [Oceanicoccus sagamiensis]|uniref:hypothetical protein n=1 Tax=Oceanicoccus sagamiensis TaxID=716816 RepID=UPI0012F52052|nr:hypothetical protein [Oceanicoccus sagamiensis]
MTLLTILVLLFGTGLIATGLFYHLKRRTLNSDPILIATCYVWGGVNIAVCIL